MIPSSPRYKSYIANGWYLLIHFLTHGLIKTLIHGNQAYLYMSLLTSELCLLLYDVMSRKYSELMTHLNSYAFKPKHYRLVLVEG